MIPERWKILITEENINIVGKYYADRINASTYVDKSRYGGSDRFLMSHNTFNNIYILEAKPGTHHSYRGNSTNKNLPIITTKQFLSLIQPSVKERLKKLVI